MTIQGLTRTQALAFLEEAASARSLITYALRVIRSGELTEEVRDPVLTMLSIGVEKMFKLTLGVSELESSGTWPNSDKTKNWGHQISSMHEAVVADLRDRSTASSSYIRGVLDDVTRDPVVRPVVDALDSYGRRGRFYHLDELGASIQSGHSPRQAWRAIEVVVAAEATVSDLTHKAMENPDDSELWAQHRSAALERVALTVDRIWMMVAGCGRSGLLGQAGRTLGLEIRH